MSVNTMKSVKDKIEIILTVIEKGKKEIQEVKLESTGDAGLLSVLDGAERVLLSLKERVKEVEAGLKRTIFSPGQARLDRADAELNQIMDEGSAARKTLERIINDNEEEDVVFEASVQEDPEPIAMMYASLQSSSFDDILDDEEELENDEENEIQKEIEDNHRRGGAAPAA